jgi:hypothetical protein
MKALPIFLVLAAAVLLSSVVSAQYAGALTFANVSVSPNPVVAGENATIRFQVYDSYDYWLYNTNIQPESSYPLLNVSPLSSKILGVVDPGLNSNYYNYTIAVPATTPSGSYTLNFGATYYVYSGLSGIVVATSTLPLSFYVQNRPTISVTAVSAQPSALYSGYNQTVNLVVENTGYGTARNVSISVAGQSGINILSSVTTFTIPNLTRGSSVTEPILVSASGTGQTGIVANVTYASASLNQMFHNTEKVNLSVAPAAQFSIGSQSSTITAGSTDVPVNFEIKNTGTSEAKQLQLELETSYPITPVASTAYITDLPVGATENVSFLVSVDTHGVPGNYPVTLYEQWKQPNGAANQQFSGSSNYYITTYGSTGTNTWVYAAVAVVIVIVALAAYTRRKVHKKKKE